ncbi:hypothetical protein LXA43DRAFT_970799 [Ganoderma leucocontextum]|nr:hypothetical protein LXA43DRAFT_970799 [Ganoderma leucocontextum]
MRERALTEQEPALCVNPADIMAGFIRSSGPSPETSPDLDDIDDHFAAITPAIPAQQLSPVQDYTADFPDEAVVDQNFPEEAISAIVSVLKSSSAKSIVPSEAFATGCEVVAPRPVIPLGDIRAIQMQYTTPAYVPYPPAFLNTPSYAFPPLAVPQQVHASPVDPPKPVLNAHVGISLEELRQRAAECRAKHPNGELDKAFLQSFAGRLSARGELLEDYRCYVIGCGQRNKRRDHILVHVGSHVEHRPWACQHCGMKFLRKNECKRHESSHEGRKPFSCQICAPFQDRSFVRQDLLKRHLRVSHGVHDTIRKKAQYKKDNTEYWP